MRLRTQLLLLTLVVLVLPWAGWQFVRGLEARLREGQAAALTDSAGVLAGALAQARPALPPPQPVWFVHEAEQPLRLDGARGDWDALWPLAQTLGSGERPPLRVVLARFGGALHLLAEVEDASRVRRDAVGPMAGDGDMLRLLLDDGDSVHALRFASAAAGRVTAGVEGDLHDAAPRVLGEWQETATGYRLELRFAAGWLPQRLGIEAVDVDAGGTMRRHGSAPDRLGGLWSLAQFSPALSQRLAALLPPGLRARVLHPHGWVLAEGGALAPFSGGQLPGWQRGLYALLAEDPPPTVPASLEAQRGSADRLQAVIAKGAASSWSRPDGGVQLMLAALAPLRIDGEPRAVLQLERRSDAALLAQQALSGLLGATLLAMLAVGLVLFAYASWLGYRVRRLGRAVDHAMSRERGAPATFAASQAQDELGELSRRFARLLVEVSGYTDYLRTLASKLSHELHTPLAIVRSSLENLEAQALDPDSRAYVQRARNGSARLAAIIRAMSESTQVERAIAAAEPERFDLRELVQGCAESYRPLIAPRRLELLLPPTPVPFCGAPELLAQALDKLVDNARGFCPEDGWIAVALALRGDEVEIAVANAGPHLPSGARERLFDSLVSVRERGSRGDGTPHLGLGLFIVKLIVELHRGEALARDLPAGNGVEFRLRLRGMPASEAGHSG